MDKEPMAVSNVTDDLVNITDDLVKLITVAIASPGETTRFLVVVLALTVAVIAVAAVVWITARDLRRLLRIPTTITIKRSRKNVRR